MTWGLRFISIAFLAGVAGATATCAAGDEACLDTSLLQTRLEVGGPEQGVVPGAAAEHAGDESLEAAVRQFEDMMRAGLNNLGYGVDELDEITSSAVGDIRSRVASLGETTLQAQADLFERLLRESVGKFLAPWGKIRGQVDDFATKAEASVSSMTGEAEAGLRGFGEKLSGNLRSAAGLADQVAARVKEAADAMVGASEQLEDGVMDAVEKATAAMTGAMNSVNDMVKTLNEGISSVARGDIANLMGLAGSSHSARMDSIQALSGDVLWRLRTASARLLDGHLQPLAQ